MVIIPIWNDTSKTQAVAASCVGQVKDNLDGARMVLVDNASKYPLTIEGVESVVLPENKGVAGAWNTGIRKTTEPYIVFLNSDCVPHGKWLDALLWGIGRLHNKKPIGAISPTMCEPSELPVLARRAPELCDGANGCCFMMSRTVLHEVGGFDERFYPAYFEDSDMWKRLELKGYSCANTMKACMAHLHAKSAEQLLDRAGIYEENKKRFKDKWDGVTSKKQHYIFAER